MRGELLVVRSVLVWGAVAAFPGAAIAFALRGIDAAFSVVIALGLVVANAAAAAAVSAFAGRRSAAGAAFAALPSFGFRMLAVFTALVALKGAPFIEDQTFALTFALAVAASIALEARAWKHTPWLAMTLSKERP